MSHIGLSHITKQNALSIYCKVDPPFFIRNVQKCCYVLESTSLNRIGESNVRHPHSHPSNANIGLSGVCFFFVWQLTADVAHLFCDISCFLFCVRLFLPNIQRSKDARATTQFFRINEWLGYKFIIIHSASQWISGVLCGRNLHIAKIGGCFMCYAGRIKVCMSRR